MSTINVQCTDQVLAITNSPVIASGGINENYIQFTFCSLWTGYAKICVFYRQRGNYFYSLIDSDDKCKIPAECCTDAGKIYFGVIGTKGDVTRTSEVLGYQIVEGAVTTIDDPTPDVYQQILNELAEVRKELENGQINISTLTVETAIADDDCFPFYDASVTANRKTLWSNIVSKIRTALFGSAKGFLKADGSGIITAASKIGTSDLDAAAVTKQFTATVTTTWSGSEAPYTQDITVTGILATDKPFVDIVPSSIWATAEAELEAFGKIFKIVPGANKITVYASEVTTTEFNIQLEVHRR